MKDWAPFPFPNDGLPTSKARRQCCPMTTSSRMIFPTQPAFLMEYIHYKERSNAIPPNIHLETLVGGPFIAGGGVEDVEGGGGGAGARFFLAAGLVGAFPLRRGDGAAAAAAVALFVVASLDIWLNISRLFRFATASSASRFENSTGDGGLGATGSAGGTGSSDRDGEMLRSPALSLLMLLSPIL